VLPTDLAARAIPAATSRMKRAAAFAFTATFTLAGCADEAAPQVDSGALTDTSIPIDNGNVADTGDDVGPLSDHAVYGAPPDVFTRPDAGAVDAGIQDDAGGGGVCYGAPPPPDGG